MTKNKQKSPSDGTLKRVHTEVADFSSSDEESKINITSKKTKIVTSESWPRFLVISSSVDGALGKLSPFAIQKGLVGLAGEPKSVKKLKNGSLLVECTKEKHSTCLLKSTSICNVPITVAAHYSLNSSKGVIRSRDLESVSEKEMSENLSSQGVISVKRISFRRNDVLVPTNTFILTFNSPTLPESVKAGYLSIPVVPYIPNPLRCFNCQKFGHGQTTCRNKKTCARCGQFDHDSKTCNNDILCINCKGNHSAYSRECPKWKLEKKVQQVKVERRLSFPDARKLVETTATAAVLERSYAAVVKVPTKSISTNTELTWPCNESKYRKLSDIQKAQKQATKAAQKQKDAATLTNIPISSKNQSSKASTEQPGSSLPQACKTMPRKETKDTKSSKDCPSGRLKKYELKSVPISNPFNPLEVDVGDKMEISSQDLLTSQTPPPKPPKDKKSIQPIIPP